MSFGGSPVSRSVTLAARIITVHWSPAMNGATVTVKVTGPLSREAGFSPWMVHLIVRPPSAIATGSLNVTVIVELVATPVAPLAGIVLRTVGASWSTLGRGLGAPVTKSAALSFVSVAPSARRSAAVRFEGAGVGPEPSKQLAVVP